MRRWRYIVIIASALLLGFWIGSKIDKGREIKENMEMAELLIDKERNYFNECNKKMKIQIMSRIWAPALFLISIMEC